MNSCVCVGAGGLHTCGVCVWSVRTPHRYQLSYETMTEFLSRQTENMEKLYCVILLHNKETCTIQNIFIKIVSGQSLAHLSGEFLEYQSKSQDWVNLRLIVQLSEVYQYHTMYHVSTYTKQSLTMSIYAGSVLKQTPSVLFTETTAVSLDIYLIQWYMISSYSKWFIIKNQKWKKKFYLRQGVFFSIN